MMLNKERPEGRSKSPIKKKYPKLDFSLFQPYAKQQEIIDHPARFKVVAFGRQSGKSWLAKRVLLEAAANEGKHCWWVAPTIPTAQDHWDDLVQLIEDSGIPTRAINHSRKTIKFWGGGYIRIRSAEVPNNLRGGTLDILVLDEAAFMVDAVWYKILQPTITASRGKVYFLSTANGQNWFYTLFMLGQNPDFPDFKSWHMPSTEAPYQDHAALEVIRKTIPDLVWREEYLCEFLADSGGVFAGIDRQVYYPMLEAPVKGHVYVMGIDWGMDNDETVILVRDKYEHRQVYGEAFTSIGTTAQIERILQLLMWWQPEVANVEINGIGKPMYNLLKEKLAETEEEQDGEGYNGFLSFNGRVRIRAILVNNLKKRKYVESYAAAIEWGHFQILVRKDPFDVTSFGHEQMKQMSTFQRKRTVGGLEVTYGAAEGYHDDYISAGYLCFIGESVTDDKVRDNRKSNTPAAMTKKPKGTLRSPFASKQRPQQSGRATSRRR